MHAVKIPRLEGGMKGPRTESCINWDGPMAGHGAVFAPRKYLHQEKVRVWRDQKCIPLVGAITPLTCAGHQHTPSRGRQYRAQNGKLGKLGRTYGHGTMFVPSKYLQQIEPTGMERPEMYSNSRCNNPTYLCGRQNTPS